MSLKDDVGLFMSKNAEYCFNSCECGYENSVTSVEFFSGSHSIPIPVNLQTCMVQCLCNVGGEGEGEGDVYYYVLEFARATEKVLIRLNALYSSYNGAEFTNWEFVEAYQEMVTKYRAG